MTEWAMVPAVVFCAAVVMISLMVVVLARRQRRMDTAAGYNELPASGVPQGPSLSAYLICYLLFLLLLTLSVAVLFGWTENLRFILAAADFRWEVNRLFYMLGMVFVGFFLFVLVAAAEPYLRGGVVQKVVLRRFMRLMLVLGGFWLVGLIGRLLAQVAI